MSSARPGGDGRTRAVRARPRRRTGLTLAVAAVVVLLGVVALRASAPDDAAAGPPAVTEQRPAPDPARSAEPDDTEGPPAVAVGPAELLEAGR